MSCCSTTGTCSTGATTVATIGAVTTAYAVTGLTCGHCEQAVGRAVTGLPGVTAVEVDVEAGLVTVVSEAEPDDEVLRAAIDGAGYALAGRI
ncbi:heavy-metal-associated domain-containing protein [Kitasatospora sp. NPDC059973]|uniref:heavy-metal-associated domain-containing protein n=1 Tax=Kitasatospora sp. NPDC059973 TaxID=3347020 RepID=UPI00367D7640